VFWHSLIFFKSLILLLLMLLSFADASYSYLLVLRICYICTQHALLQYAASITCLKSPPWHTLTKYFFTVFFLNKILLLMCSITE
jgi:hypothetical protein